MFGRRALFQGLGSEHSLRLHCALRRRRHRLGWQSSGGISSGRWGRLQLAVAQLVSSPRAGAGRLSSTITSPLGAMAQGHGWVLRVQDLGLYSCFRV